MPARTGMTALIAQLRAACAVGTADYTNGPLTYWTDDQLQSELDVTRRAVYFVPLHADPEYEAGATVYRDYLFPPDVGRHFERAGTDSGFALRASGGGAVAGTAYTVNYEARTIRFNTDQAGAAYFLDVRTYNFYRAAASVWRQKAGFAAGRYDWSADNHAMQASQEYAHCLAQAQHYDALDGLRIAEIRRLDDVWGE